jgi:MFS family permease
VLYALVNIASTVPNLAAASLGRRFGLVRTVTTLRVIAAALLVFMAFMPSFLLAGAVYLVRMVVQRLGMPLRQSYVMGIAPEEERASVSGLSNLPAQGASAVSPPLSGYLFDHVSLALPFALSGALQLVNASLYYALFHHLRPPEEAEQRLTAVRAEAPIGVDPEDTH